MPVDFARWTTTLTASYLAITAALIAIRGTTVPGRTWLVAAHLALSGSLVILNRARPSAGILRVIRDWHPLMPSHETFYCPNCGRIWNATRT
jgi:hypothetical protein